MTAFSLSLSSVLFPTLEASSQMVCEVIIVGGVVFVVLGGAVIGDGLIGIGTVVGVTGLTGIGEAIVGWGAGVCDGAGVCRGGDNNS